MSTAVPQPLQAIIAPSILACDFARLKDECEDVLSEAGGACEWLHLDVMDAHFVPNLTFGPPIIQSLRRHLPHAFFDVHLMIAEPARWVEEYAKAGASQYTFHIEAVADLTAAAALCAAIKAQKMHVGISLKPQTPLAAVLPLLEQGLVDTLLVMTVEPGFGGQSFMAAMMEKVAAARAQFPLLTIQVDGGLAPGATIESAAAAGANAIVAGTSIFKAPSRGEATRQMRQVVQDAINKKQ